MSPSGLFEVLLHGLGRIRGLVVIVQVVRLFKGHYCDVGRASARVVIVIANARYQYS